MKNLLRKGMRAMLATAFLSMTLAIAGAGIAGDDVVKCGSDLGKSPTVDLAKVMKTPEKYADKTVTLVGTVKEVCQKKGCWMEVMCDEDTGIRVTFKDYGFFVPKDAHGMMVKAEGIFETKVLSKEEADHLEREGAKLMRNPDGTATELGFVATGVELRKPEEPKAEKS